MASLPTSSCSARCAFSRSSCPFSRRNSARSSRRLARGRAGPATPTIRSPKPRLKGPPTRSRQDLGNRPRDESVERAPVAAVAGLQLARADAHDLRQREEQVVLGANAERVVVLALRVHREPDQLVGLHFPPAAPDEDE